jgi:hypothetical protein
MALTIALGMVIVVPPYPIAGADDNDGARVYETEHVMLVIIDGLRYTEGLGDTSYAFVPRMHALSQRGAIVEPFTNDRHTNTMRGIPAIWCGGWTEVIPFKDRSCGGGDNIHCEMPTVFEYYRKGLDRNEDDCIYVLGDVGCPWKASLASEYGPDFWPRYHSVGVADMEVWEQAVDILETFHPSFFLLYLMRVDHFGHSGSWTYYTRSIELADSIVGMLWDYVEADSFYSGKTTMLVTNDHGRHTHDFSGHDCDCEGCRTVQLLAVGPDIMEGLISTVPRTICDITPTIGELMGFPTPAATGSVMHELLLHDTGQDTKRAAIEDTPPDSSAAVLPGAAKPSDTSDPPADTEP